MTRVMYDSTNIADDPLGADLVGYYVDGIYATTAAKVRQRFPTAVLVPISAIGSNAGIVGDVEPGCMTIQQAVAWVRDRRASGVDPTLYVNQIYGWLPAREAFVRAGVAPPHWWVANYDGVANIPFGAVAKQYQNPPFTHGHFDRSVVADYWPGVDVRAGDSSHHTEEAMTPEVAKMHIREAYFFSRPVGEPTQAEFDAALARAQVSDQACAEEFVTITETAEAKAYRARLAAIVAGGPATQGPKGDTGPEGPPGKDGAPGQDAPQLPAPPAGALSWLQSILKLFGA